MQGFVHPDIDSEQMAPQVGVQAGSATRDGLSATGGPTLVSGHNTLSPTVVPGVK